MNNSFASDINEIIINENDQKPWYTLDLELTKECNFRCLYCYERNGNYLGGKMSLKTAEAVVSSILRLRHDQWFNEKFRGFNIGFWGGEPTLNFEVIRYVLESLIENDNICFHIYTNASNIEKLCELISELHTPGNNLKGRFSVQISYDGAGIHEKYRKPQDIDKIVDTVIQHGLIWHFKSTLPMTAISSLPEAWDDFYRLFKKYNNNIAYNPTIDSTSNQVEDMEEFRKAMIILARKEVKFHDETGRFLSSFFGGSNGHCVAGKTMSAVDVNGRLCYCHGCFYSENVKDFYFGNIETFSIDQIKANYTTFKTEEELSPRECRRCEVGLCLKCNVFKYTESKKETFIDKWYDNCSQPSLCELYRMIGEFSFSTKDLIVQRKLERNK